VVGCGPHGLIWTHAENVNHELVEFLGRRNQPVQELAESLREEKLALLDVRQPDGVFIQRERGPRKQIPICYAIMGPVRLPPAERHALSEILEPFRNLGGSCRSIRGDVAAVSRPTRSFHRAKTAARRSKRDVDLSLHLP
jgi:hypothetical protein